MECESVQRILPGITPILHAVTVIPYNPSYTLQCLLYSLKSLLYSMSSLIYSLQISAILYKHSCTPCNHSYTLQYLLCSLQSLPYSLKIFQAIILIVATVIYHKNTRVLPTITPMPYNHTFLPSTITILPRITPIPYNHSYCNNGIQAAIFSLSAGTPCGDAAVVLKGHLPISCTKTQQGQFSTTEKKTVPSTHMGGSGLMQWGWQPLMMCLYPCPTPHQ